MTLNLGIDEAGRGPVIGPLVICGCIVNSSDKKELIKLGIKDSKQLSPKKREELFTIIIQKYKYEYLVILPKEIDGAVKSDDDSLNDLEAKKAAEIIIKLKLENKIDSVVIDCPSTNRESWKNYVFKHINENKKGNLILACEHKADRDYAACSAASILAKSEREKQVREIKKKIGKDFGSGYPSDPATIDFLKNYSKEHKKDGIFRETWATFQNHKAKKEQKNLLDFNK